MHQRLIMLHFESLKYMNNFSIYTDSSWKRNFFSCLLVELFHDSRKWSLYLHNQLFVSVSMRFQVMREAVLSQNSVSIASTQTHRVSLKCFERNVTSEWFEKSVSAWVIICDASTNLHTEENSFINFHEREYLTKVISFMLKSQK